MQESSDHAHITFINRRGAYLGLCIADRNPKLLAQTIHFKVSSVAFAQIQGRVPTNGQKCCTYRPLHILMRGVASETILQIYDWWQRTTQFQHTGKTKQVSLNEVHHTTTPSQWRVTSLATPLHYTYSSPTQSHSTRATPRMPDQTSLQAQLTNTKPAGHWHVEPDDFPVRALLKQWWLTVSPSYCSIPKSHS